MEESMEKNNFGSGFYQPNVDLRDECTRIPTMAQICGLYSLGVILLLFIGFRVQKQYLYPGLLVTEFLLVLLPSLALLFIFKYDVKKVLRLNRVSLINLLIIFLIMVFAIPAVGALNLINLALIKQVFGRVVVSSVPEAENTGELIINLLIVGGSAGICEEIMFRGVLQRGFERLGAKKAILITALLFGLFHLDFQRLLGTFLLGALIGYIVHRTNSLFAGMFAHFTNNSIAVVITYISNKLTQTMQKSGLDSSQTQLDANEYFSAIFSLPARTQIVVVFTWFFIFSFCLSILIGLIIALVRTTSDRVEKYPARERNTGKKGVLWILPGLVLIILMYITQGFGLMGLSSNWAIFLYKFMGIG